MPGGRAGSHPTPSLGPPSLLPVCLRPCRLFLCSVLSSPCVCSGSACAFLFFRGSGSAACPRFSGLSRFLRLAPSVVCPLSPASLCVRLLLILVRFSSGTCSPPLWLGYLRSTSVPTLCPVDVGESPSSKATDGRPVATVDRFFQEVDPTPLCVGHTFRRMGRRSRGTHAEHMKPVPAIAADAKVGTPRAARAQQFYPLPRHALPTRRCFFGGHLPLTRRD